jgi:hypothetical protein
VRGGRGSQRCCAAPRVPGSGGGVDVCVCGAGGLTGAWLPESASSCCTSESDRPPSCRKGGGGRGASMCGRTATYRRHGDRQGHQSGGAEAAAVVGKGCMVRQRSMAPRARQRLLSHAPCSHLVPPAASSSAWLAPPRSAAAGCTWQPEAAGHRRCRPPPPPGPLAAPGPPPSCARQFWSTCAKVASNPGM